MARSFAVVLYILLFALPLLARGGHGGHRSNSRSYASHSSRSYSSRSYSSHSYRTRSSRYRPGYLSADPLRNSPMRQSNTRRLSASASLRSTSPRVHHTSGLRHNRPIHIASLRKSSVIYPRSSNHHRKRSEAAKDAFKREHPCPSTGKRSGPCPGYVIDHIQPLSKGGADAPANMQWQTTAAAKAKDRWERK
jgi:hypothetical protein